MISLNGTIIGDKKFPNGETILEKTVLSQALTGLNDRLELYYEGDADLFQLLLIRKAIWLPIDLHIYYMPYSRMDRKNESYTFTLTALTKFINWLDFRKVYVYEPHSDVTPALLNHCTTVPVTVPLLYKTPFNKEKDLVYFPDAGAYKRYNDVVQTERALVGVKKRDFKTGKLSHLMIMGKIMDAYDTTVFIVDDLCSKGGTFVMAVEHLKEMGVKEVNLVVAHCEPTIFRGTILQDGLIKKVYTTNSILQEVPAPFADKLQILKLPGLT